MEIFFQNLRRPSLGVCNRYDKIREGGVMTIFIATPNLRSKYDSPKFHDFKIFFRLKIGRKFCKLPLDFQKFFPIEFFFSKNFKIIVESSQIAYSIRNFILFLIFLNLLIVLFLF